jgi:hypothetical protein
MARQFLTSIDLNKNELLNARLQNLAVEPTNPVVGQFYFDTQQNHIRQWDGTQWLDYITAEAGAGYITNSDSTNFTVSGQTLYLNPNVTLGGSTSDYGSLTILDNTGNVTFQSGTDGGPYTIAQGYFSVAYPTNGYSAFNVDSGGSVTTVRNVLNAVTDDNQTTVTINGNEQSVVFSNTSGTQTGGLGSDGDNNIVVTAFTNNLSLQSNNGDVNILADGTIRPKSNVIQDNGYSITSGNNLYSKRSYIGGSDYGFDGYLDIRNAAGNLIFGVDAGHIADQGYNSYTVAGQIDINAQINLNTEDGNPAGHLFTNQDGVIHLESNGDLALRAGANGGNGDIILYTGGTSGRQGKVFVGWNNDNGQYQQNEVATKGYVDATSQGLNVKQSVKAAANSYADLGITVDGITINDGDRVLALGDDVLDAGIYVASVIGGEATFTRAADQQTPEVGDFVFVELGTTHGAQGWILNHVTDGYQVWTQFSAAGEYTAGTNISISGNTIGITGQVAVENGGTGASTAAGARANLGATTKYAETNGALTATSGAVTWTVNHGLGSRDVTVQVFELGSYQQVEVDVVRTDANNVNLIWVSGDVTANSYRVVVVG